VQIQSSFLVILGEYKGLGCLLQAVPIIQKRVRNVKIIIAGEGDLSPYWSQIEACGRSAFEIYNEFVPNDLVASLFQRSTLAVLPYTEMSGMSGVLNVAYAFGKPVVVSDVGGLDEAVETREDRAACAPQRSSGISRCYHSSVSRF
jgi:glycosyltransferase involved in cell wall biosynthesis